MTVTHVAAEMAPLAKTGGLGDVLGALPPAQARLGQDVAVILPCHRAVRAAGIAIQPRPELGEIPTWVGGTRECFTVSAADRAALGLPVWLLSSPRWFEREGIYGEGREVYADNPLRWAAFAQAAIELLRRLGRGAGGIVHLHDHHAALLAPYLRDGPGDPELRAARLVLTIHNVAYQGLAAYSAFTQAGFPSERFFAGSPYEFHGQLSLLKTGIVFADAITTVSPTHATEILTPEGGFGLDGLLRERRAALTGILNGIDTARWDPEQDALLPARYSARDLKGKARCRTALLERFGLPSSAGPVLGMISRLTEQKGLDLVEAVLEDILRLDMKLVVLGVGEWRWTDFLSRAQRSHPGSIAARFEMDDEAAHLIEAGSDLFLMPSRWEPCGLNQMYSLRYGTPPVVRRTGGLADTVSDADAAEGGTGFVFDLPTPAALRGALERAARAFADRRRFRRIQRAGMAQDFSWERAARAYFDVYRNIAD